MPQNIGLNDPLLMNEWFAVAWSTSVPTEQLQPVRVLNHDLVLWRSDEGVHAWRDLCVHRGSRLSLGRIYQSEEGACVICPYHGWEYASSGKCVRIPAQPSL